MYFGVDALKEDYHILYPESIVVYEFDFSETINNIKKRIKQAILSFIDKVEKWLDKHKDSKIKSAIKSILEKARKLLTKSDNIKDQSDAKDVSEELNKCSEEFKEETKSETKESTENKSESKDEEKKEDNKEESVDSKDKFADLYHKTYENVKKLVAATPWKDRVKNIVPEDDEEKFIKELKNWEVCDQFYSFVRRRYIEDEGSEFQRNQLKSAVWSYISTHIKTAPASENKYSIYGNDDSGYIGDKFDSDIMSIKGIKTDGIVKKVLLFGIRDTKTNEFPSKYKILVEVEDDKSKEELKSEPKIHKALEKAVESKDLRGLKYIFVDCLDVDPTFEKYKADWEYCEKECPELFEENKELTPFYEDKSKWNEDYYVKLKMDLLKNFSKKRFNFMRKVVTVTHKNKIERLMKERGQK